MSHNYTHLLTLRSRLAEDIIAFCDAVIERLDTTNFSFKGADGTSAPVAISTTVIDLRVFTLERLPDPRDNEPNGPSGRKTEDSAPPTAHEKAIADLNENPWLTEQRKNKPWSHAFADARPGRPLVIRGAPGGGKTTLSRHSTLLRLRAVRDALMAHTLLAQDTEPMLWTTCTGLAECPDAPDPADLVINAAFHALRLPEYHRARSVGVHEWLRIHIQAGRCPVAVDSLDEVKEEQRSAFQTRAPRLLDLPSPVVLTCRVVEWEQRRGWTGWGGREEGPYEIAPLNQKEQRTYTERFFHECITQPDKLQGIRSALAANLPLRRTCESPILLVFACLLHAEGELAGAVRRTDLYQRIRRRLFLGEWKGLPNPPIWADGKIREARVTAWLSEIALALFRAAPESKTFALSAWDTAVASPGATPTHTRITPPLAADELFSDLEQCGFLVYAGWGTGDEPHYSFPHRSFIAFLAGRALAARPREEWMKEAIDHLWFQPAWDDVILFLSGHLNESDADALIEGIENQPEDIFRQRLRWQWRIAGEVVSLPAKWGERWTKPAMSIALGDENFCSSDVARYDLLKVLGGVIHVAPPVLESLLPSVDSIDEFNRNVRLKIVQALGLIGGQRTAEVLRLTLTREPFGFVRKAIVEALAKHGGEQSLEALLLSLDLGREPDSQVRRCVANTFLEFCEERYTETLELSLDPDREPDSTVRGTVVRVLGRFGGERSFEALRQSLDPAREPDFLVRGEVVGVLGRSGREKDIKALKLSRDAAREPTEYVSSCVARELTKRDGVTASKGVIVFCEKNKMDKVRSLAELRLSLDSALEIDSEARLKAANTIATIYRECAVEVLLPSLYPTNEPSYYVRNSIAEAFGKIGGKRAEDALLLCIDPAREPDYTVRWKASISLEKIGGQRAVEALLPSLRAMRESDPIVRRRIADVLFLLYWRTANRVPFLLLR
jgi:HEAT repeat protein